ncbi:MAG: V4R domain-containing protein [Anaerolineae bacterium]
MGEHRRSDQEESAHLVVEEVEGLPTPDVTGEPPARYYYSNRIARAYLMGLEEVLGKNGVHAVLNLAGWPRYVNNYPPSNFELGFPFEAFAAIQWTLDEMYGRRGGKGLATRAGKAAFKHGLAEFEAVLGIADLALRLLPLGMKIRIGANVFAEVFNKYSHQIVRLEEAPDHLMWINERCPVCWGRKTEEPCCHAATGILTEGLHWLSGGKNFRVEEVTCIATGDDSCRFRITKRPVD